MEKNLNTSISGDMEEKVLNLFDENDLIILPVNNLESRYITWRNSLKQIVACCIAHSIVIQAGVNLSFSAVLVPQLCENKTGIQIDKSKASWIASLVTISLPLGSLIIGPLMDKFGRKRMCLFTTLPSFASWLLITYATTVWHIYVARIISGFTSGLSTVSLVYVSEISHPNFRPMLLSFNSVFVSFGILITCCLGLWFRWKSMAMIYGALSLLSFISIWFIPESPYWFVTFKNDTINASKSLRWIYDNNQIFEDQFQKLLQVSKSKKDKSCKKPILKKIFKPPTVYTKPSVYKPFLLLVVMFIFQQLSGVYVIIFYAVILFRKLGGEYGTKMSEYVALVLLGLIRFVMAIVLSLVSKKIERRSLLVISYMGMCVTSLIAGLYMSLSFIPQELAKYNITKGESDDNIPIFCVLFYVCASSLGNLVIPWTLIGELLPVNVRGKLGGLIVSFAYILMFALVKGFPYLLDAVEIQCIFYIFASVTLCAAIFNYVFLPETLGKSFKDIEEYFEKSERSFNICRINNNKEQE